ncbi:MAG: sulfurtransferase-like selenium metabolism protein YedF [Cyanobacteria bacterium REEB67]|nr:sulfurtransferase-like selenium metabolism protein YedF [Cyanobacteria bacterium REEB67]
MKKEMDLRGLSCPEPVLRTKKAIDDQTVSGLEVLVDDEVNVQNLERLARSQKFTFKKENLSGHFRLTLTRAAGMAKSAKSSTKDAGYDEDDLAAGHRSKVPTTAAAPSTVSPPRGGGTVVFLAKETFGQGADQNQDHDFSHNLLNVFLQTVQQSALKPRAILLANAGVKLIDPQSSTYKVLEDLKNDGVTVLACGLCLDYYKLKEKVPVEQITNMFAICEYLFAADQVISP